jgi:quinol monooxygenase YgiN
MKRCSRILILCIGLTAGFSVRSDAQASSATAYTVSYIEVQPASRAAAAGALKAYRAAVGKEPGFVRLELFEQVDRPGHFCFLEAWTDSKASDAHMAGPSMKQLRSAVDAYRLSDFDQRPYKDLTVTPPGTVNDQTLYVITHVDIGGAAGTIPALLQRLSEASRKEEGNRQFDVLQHTMRANHFQIIEAWRNAAALAAHAAAAHTREYRNTLQASLGSPLDERIYRMVN